MFYLNAFLLTFIVAFVVDFSGVVEEIRPRVNGVLKRAADARIKPFDCSLCLTFWSGILLCAFQGFTIPRLAFVCFCAILARFIGEGIFLLNEALAATIRLLTNKIDTL